MLWTSGTCCEIDAHWIGNHVNSRRFYLCVLRCVADSLVFTFLTVMSLIHVGLSSLIQSRWSCCRECCWHFPPLCHSTVCSVCCLQVTVWKFGDAKVSLRLPCATELGFRADFGCHKASSLWPLDFQSWVSPEQVRIQAVMEKHWLYLLTEGTFFFV